MAKKPLTDTALKNARPKASRYRITDGNGLAVLIRPTGTKSFVFTYSEPFVGRRIDMTLGTYPAVSLLEARQQALELKMAVQRGENPLNNRQQFVDAKRQQLTSTLKNVAFDWIKLKKERVTADYADDIMRSLELHVFRRLGNLPLSELTPRLVIDALRPLERAGKRETLRRVTQRINEIMVYACNTGIIEANPLANIGAAFPPPVEQHFPTLAPEQLPGFLFTLQRTNVTTATRCLIEFQLHTMARPSEAATVMWREINWDEALWIKPAEKMKNGLPHRVPLSTQVIALLAYLKPYSGQREYIFPGSRNPKSHINEQTANMAIKRMGFKGQLVAHGLRSIASTVLNNANFNSDWVETALSHAEQNAVRAAYNRADYLEGRRHMMQWWSDYIEAASAKSTKGAAQ